MVIPHKPFRLVRDDTKNKLNFFEIRKPSHDPHAPQRSPLTDGKKPNVPLPDKTEFRN
jgi:hypothetical protein